MRSRFAHTPGTATGAESTALTTEGDQVFELTGLALGPQKPVRQNPTAQILIKLFDHKVWQWVARIIFDLVLKSEPVVLDNFVEDCFFGLMPGVGVLFERRI